MPQIFGDILCFIGKLPTFKPTWGPKIRKFFFEKTKKTCLRNVLKIIYPRGIDLKMSRNMFKKISTTPPVRPS